MINWYSIGDKTGFSCCSCSNFIVVESGGLDHHPNYCPECNVECVILEWKKWIQVVTKNAPTQFCEFIKWTQENLDELEFVELICNFEELAEKLYNKI